MTDPAKFYGTAFTPERQDKLTKACRYLDMACSAENETKQGMAFRAALKNEQEAFG